MIKRTVRLFAAVLLLQAAAYDSNGQSDDSNGQSDEPRFEVGTQFSVLRFGDLDVTEPGLGSRLTYNINDNLAVEAEGNFFPNSRGRDEIYGSLQGGRKTQMLFGAKFGARSGRIGMFGKLRPGFVHFGNFERNLSACLLDGRPCPPQPPAAFSETDFAMDIGGVLELYTSRRSLIRVDVGDTIIRPTSGEEIVLPGVAQSRAGPLRSVVGVTRSTNHNLQINVGVGFRF